MSTPRPGRAGRWGMASGLCFLISSNEIFDVFKPEASCYIICSLLQWRATGGGRSWLRIRPSCLYAELQELQRARAHCWGVKQSPSNKMVINSSKVSGVSNEASLDPKQAWCYLLPLSSQEWCWWAFLWSEPLSLQAHQLCKVAAVTGANLHSCLSCATIKLLFRSPLRVFLELQPGEMTPASLMMLPHSFERLLCKAWQTAEKAMGLLSQRGKYGVCDASFLDARFLCLPVSQQGKEIIV